MAPRAAQYVTPDQPPDSWVCQAVCFPVGQTWQALLAGALLELCDPAHFESVGGMSPEDAALVFQEVFVSFESGTCEECE